MGCWKAIPTIQQFMQIKLENHQKNRKKIWAELRGKWTDLGGKWADLAGLDFYHFFRRDIPKCKSTCDGFFGEAVHST